MKAIFEPLFEDTVLPTRATQGSAGYDLSAYLRGRQLVMYNMWNETFEPQNDNDGFVYIHPHCRALLPCGFKATLPQGTFAQVSLRSGIGLKSGLIKPNAPGIIDWDYVGEYGVLVTNVSDQTVEIAHGQRIAQMVIQRYEVIDFEQGVVVQTTSRVGGLGSTGR